VTRLAGSPDRLLYVAPPATAPGAPTKVAVSTNQATRAVTLRWAPPTRNGGAKVTGYRLTRDGRDARGRGRITVAVPRSTTRYTFKNLREGAAYGVTVRAVNRVGAGRAVTRTTARLG
jgi:hypothetical protein